MNKQHRRLLSLLKRKLESSQNVSALRVRVKESKGAFANFYRLILLKNIKCNQRLQHEINEWVYCNIECEHDVKRAIKFSRYLLFVKNRNAEDSAAIYFMFENQLKQMRRFI